MPSIKLYGFQKAENEPSASGYCQKLESLLKITGFTNYTHHSTSAPSAPKGKLPYVEIERDDGKVEVVSDSHFITRHLVDNGIVPDPDRSLTAAQRADSRAWQAWTEELMYPVLVYQRWLLPANFERSKTILPVPGFLLPFVAWYLQRNIRNAMWAQGVGRHTDGERMALVREYVEGLDARLGGGGGGDEYFHGSEPTGIDAVLYGFLANALAQPGNAEFSGLVMASERLKRYTAGLTRRWFPEYEGLLAAVEQQGLQVGLWASRGGECVRVW